MEITEHTTPATRAIRASDADRDTTSIALHQAAAAGMLTLAEVDERMTSLYTAKFRHELDTLVEDLPAEPTSTRVAHAGDTVLGSVRAVGAAVIVLLLSLGALARRHPRITAVAGVGLVAMFLAFMAFGGVEMNGAHELHGAHEIGGQ